MQFASEFVPGATSGNTTEIDIEAPPELVWKALQALRFDDLRVTKLLIGIRSLPGVALGRGPLRHQWWNEDFTLAGGHCFQPFHHPV